MSFFRHEEIYHFDEGHGKEGAIPPQRHHAPTHRTDEFPAGYSSAGCSPAVPASASPASAILLELILNAKDFAANGILSLIPVSQPWGSLQSLRFSPVFQKHITAKRPTIRGTAIRGTKQHGNALWAILLRVTDTVGEFDEDISTPSHFRGRLFCVQHRPSSSIGIRFR